MKGCLNFIALFVVVAPALFSGVGCKTAAITNLTPSQVPRSPDGEYRFEVAWERIQKNVRQQSVEPNLVVGMEVYPMTESPIATNRWEASVILPDSVDSVTYFYKFNYEYSGLMDVKPSNVRSPEYRLRILPQVYTGEEMDELSEFTGPR